MRYGILATPKGKKREKKKRKRKKKEKKAVTGYQRMEEAGRR